MNKFFLCHSSFCREINFEKLFFFVKFKERYTCSECLKSFLKRKEKEEMDSEELIKIIGQYNKKDLNKNGIMRKLTEIDYVTEILEE